ncbi:endonuclease V [Natronosporangium hydrolyticum]|uniref:Endonuclease V n=1 Tax=Natronosporangium hydrolyticum TaxID=2811111 RepID=A0A895Y984_9ACTN|nr:endonuclease V [Natronosporangium hydrolyticum]QSB12832.1 endonuclease V [Natronosporangium hydrolyticum]
MRADDDQRCGAVDVHYPTEGGARAALVVAGDLRFRRIISEHTTQLPEVADYQPGRFYLRELPAVMAVLATTVPLDLLVIDGYVDLDPQGRPGLGARLHAQSGVPIIGVAKTAYRGATHAVAVRRGQTTRPLFVTAVGIAAADAAAIVDGMAGPYRLPDSLRRVDTLARGLSVTSR